MAHHQPDVANDRKAKKQIRRGTNTIIHTDMDITLGKLKYRFWECVLISFRDPLPILCKKGVFI